MAGYVLHLSEQENITLSAAVTRRLIDGGDGDAALLYLCLLKNRGSASPETLRAELKWDEARRPRPEAGGFDVGRTARELFGIELKWGVEGRMPEYLTLVCGFFHNAGHIVWNG